MHDCMRAPGGTAVYCQLQGPTASRGMQLTLAGGHSCVPILVPFTASRVAGKDSHHTQATTAPAVAA